MPSHSFTKDKEKDDVDNYFDLDDSRTIGIKELDINTLYPQHPLDYKNGSKYCFIGKPGCHKKGTKIMMSDRTLKNVEDILIGDTLMGDDFTIRNVLDLARGREEMYNIIQNEGETYTVNKHHILCLRCVSDVDEYLIDDILEISVLNFINQPENWRSNFKGYKAGSNYYSLHDLTIEYENIDDYYGFEIDGNNRYLLGDFTVTHNTGKSTLIKSLLYAKKHIFSVGAFWSGTEDSNGFFGSFAPATFIRDGSIDAANAEHLKPLENLNKRQKIARKYLEPRGDNPWCVEVLDDCTADNKFLKKTVVKDTYKNGRHKAKMHILSLQFCLDIPTEIRGLFDGTFICRESNPKNRMRLFENFGSCVDNIGDWNDLMDGLTDDYCCMFVNNKSTSNNIEDCIFYYKADPNKIPKEWKFGCKEYWDFHYDRYNPKYVESF